MPFKNLFKKPPRTPQESAALAAVTGAVVIRTEDGHSIVVTPTLADRISSMLPHLSEKAKGDKNETPAENDEDRA